MGTSCIVVGLPVQEEGGLNLEAASEEAASSPCRKASLVSLSAAVSLSSNRASGTSKLWSQKEGQSPSGCRVASGFSMDPGASRSSCGVKAQEP